MKDKKDPIWVIIVAMSIIVIGVILIIKNYNPNEGLGFPWI